MKKLIIATIFLLSGKCYAQTKDSVQYLPDSVNTISIKDINNVIDYLYGRVSKKDYEMFIQAYQTLIAATDNKRKVITKPKK